MVEKIQLKNGFKVLLNRQSKSPVLSLQVWVANGSAHEKEDEAGLSHFIEHLVFKGTTSFGPGEIAQTIEGSGGQLNAYTTFDQTVYYVTLGKSEYYTGLKALSEMVFEPLFDSEEVDKEREVVIEEIRRGLDEPSRINSQFAFKNFFKNHTYGRPIIGYDDVVKHTPVEKIKAYFKEQYHPKNMFLLVTGDFEDSIIKDIEQLFSKDDFDANFKQREVGPTQSSQGSEFAFLKTDFEDTFYNLYWPAPDVKTKDYLCLELLALILGQGESSRLYKKLKLEEELVRGIGAYSFSIKNPGLFAITATPLQGQESDMILSIVNVMNQIAAEGIDVEEFEKAITNFKSDLYYSLETCDGQARQIGQVAFFYNDENYLQKYLQILDEITIEDVLHSFKTYLMKTPSIYVTSKNEKLNTTDALAAFQAKLIEPEKLTQNTKQQKPFKVDLNWHQRPIKKSEIQSFTLDSGIRVILKDQPETPVVHLDMGFLGGAKKETSSEDIYSSFVQRCWGRSTNIWDEARVLFEFDKKASSLSAFSGKHSIGMQLSTLSSYRDYFLDQLPEFFINTEVKQGMIEREKKLMLEQLKRRKDNPAQIAFLEFMKIAFADHYYAKDNLHKLNEGAEITSKGLSEFITNHFNPKDMVIAMVGDLGELDKIKIKLQKFEQQIPWNQKEVSFKNSNEFPESFEKYIQSDKEQAHIVFGFRALDYSSEDKITLSVIQSILAGQGGRLFIELRDKESLAYTVSPIKMEGLEGGYFGSYIACAPTKKEKAIAMMQTEFEKLTTDLVPEVEIQNAKKSLIGKIQISLQRNSNISESMFFDSLYGEDYRSYLLLEEKIKAVSSKDVMDLMQKLYSRPKYTIVVG